MNKNNIAMLEEFKINLGLEVERGNVRDNTATTYITASTQLVEYLQDKPLDQVSKNDAMIWLMSLSNKTGAKAKASTRNLKQGACCMFYKYLLEEDIVQRNPFANIKIEKISIKGEDKNQDTKEALEKDEVKRLMKVLDYNIANPTNSKGKTKEEALILAYRDKAFISFMLATGMRVQEVCKLKMEQIDTTTYDDVVMVTVIAKNAKSKIERQIPVEIEKYQYILDYKAIVKKESEYVFATKTGGKLGTTDANDIIKKVCKQAKIEKNISSHCLRHTFGTEMVNSTDNIKAVAELMGHSTTRQLEQRYWHQTEETKKLVYHF